MFNHWHYVWSPDICWKQLSKQKAGVAPVAPKPTITKDVHLWSCVVENVTTGKDPRIARWKVSAYEIVLEFSDIPKCLPNLHSHRSGLFPSTHLRKTCHTVDSHWWHLKNISMWFNLFFSNFSLMSYVVTIHMLRNKFIYKKTDTLMFSWIYFINYSTVYSSFVTWVLEYFKQYYYLIFQN